MTDAMLKTCADIDANRSVLDEADVLFGVSPEQQAVLDSDLQQRALHQTPGQAYIRCFATNKLPAEALDAKFALAKIIDDLYAYDAEITKRFQTEDIPLEKMSDVFSEIQIVKAKLADVSMWINRIFTTHW